jgi:hypothetical protein
VRHAPGRLIRDLIADLDGFAAGCPASDDVTALMVRYHGQIQDGPAAAITAEVGCSA